MSYEKNKFVINYCNIFLLFAIIFSFSVEAQIENPKEDYIMMHKLDGDGMINLSAWKHEVLNGSWDKIIQCLKNSKIG